MRSDSQKATLRQVARAAGVSLKTASRVLNHEPHVKPATETAVRTAMERLAYRPNELARSLKSRRSGIIGVSVPFLSHYFVAAVVEAIHHAAESAGATIILTIADGDPAAEAAHIRALLRRQVEGLIIFPTTGNLQKECVVELAQTPVVVIDQPTLEPGIDSVMVPNRMASYEAVKHLIGHRYRRIAVIGANRLLHTISERLIGYREALHEAGLKTLELVPASEEELSVNAICKLFDQPRNSPRAVFALNSFACIRTLHALKQSRRQIPQDVAVIGFDDFDTADAFQPSITVVRQPTEEIGRNAVELLFKRILQQRQRPGQRLVLPTQMIARASCGCS